VAKAKGFKLYWIKKEIEFFCINQSIIVLFYFSICLLLTTDHLVPANPFYLNAIPARPVIINTVISLIEIVKWFKLSKQIIGGV